MAEVLRKSAQEVEIDHLLAEEFACDSGFVARFLSAGGIALDGFRVVATIAEPSLGGDGFGDLLIEGTIQAGSRAALLIEDKITAGPAVRQVERYAAFARVLRESGFGTVLTVLVAPASYRGERDHFDAFISLETVATLITSHDPPRLSYRRRIIERALSKKRGMGVRVPDQAMRHLRDNYLQFAAGWCTRERLQLTFPHLRDAYYDGDSWVDGITHPDLPTEVRIRHRLWTTLEDRCGLVDLIILSVCPEYRQKIVDLAPMNSRIAPYSKDKGIQVSISVPELRQKTGFDDQIGAQVFETIRKLLTWYRTSLT